VAATGIKLITPSTRPTDSSTPWPASPTGNETARSSAASSSGSSSRPQPRCPPKKARQVPGPGHPVPDVSSRVAARDGDDQIPPQRRRVPGRSHLPAGGAHSAPCSRMIRLLGHELGLPAAIGRAASVSRAWVGYSDHRRGDVRPTRGAARRRRDRSSGDDGGRRRRRDLAVPCVLLRMSDRSVCRVMAALTDTRSSCVGVQ